MTRDQFTTILRWLRPCNHGAMVRLYNQGWTPRHIYETRRPVDLRHLLNRLFGTAATLWWKELWWEESARAYGAGATAADANAIERDLFLSLWPFDMVASVALQEAQRAGGHREDKL